MPVAARIVSRSRIAVVMMIISILIIERRAVHQCATAASWKNFTLFTFIYTFFTFHIHHRKHLHLSYTASIYHTQSLGSNYSLCHRSFACG